jgi:hypothetical protein
MNDKRPSMAPNVWVVQGGAMTRIYGLIATGLVCAVLAGCASLPDFSSDAGADTALTVEDIVHHISCEIANSHDLPQMKGAVKGPGYLATVLLSLQVDDSVDLTPSLSMTQILPKPATSLVTLLNGDLGGARRRLFTTTYSIDISKLSYTCACPNLPKTKAYNLRGDLGIAAIIHDGLSSQNDHLFPDDIITQARNPTDKSGPAFGSQVQFVVTKSITGLGSVWTLKYFKGPGGTNGLISGKRLDTDSVIITFAPQPLPTPKATTAALVAAVKKTTDDAIAAASLADQKQQIADQAQAAQAATEKRTTDQAAQLDAEMTILGAKARNNKAIAAEANALAQQQQDLAGKNLAAATATVNAERAQIRADQAAAARHQAEEALAEATATDQQGPSAAAAASQQLLNTMLLQNLVVSH